MSKLKSEKPIKAVRQYLSIKSECIKLLLSCKSMTGLSIEVLIVLLCM